LCFLTLLLLASWSGAQAEHDPAASVGRALAAAESRLAAGDLGRS
jgi:hypothetical protein